LYYYWYGFDGYWMGPVTEHTVWNRLPAGRYLQTLSVQGNSGLWNTTIRHFNVEYSGNNTPPVAIINDPQNNETFPVNTSVRFSSSDSYDPDGSIVSRTWRISLWSTLLKTIVDEVNFTYVFPLEGSYRIELFVTDDGGKERSAWMEVQIAGENRAPVANIIAPEAGSTHLVGDPVEFSSEGSFDPEGDELTYLWNFGDGATSGEANPVHYYFSAGEQIVTLKVQDPAGLSASATLSILLAVPAQNLTAAILSPENGARYNTSEAVSFSAEARSWLPAPDFTYTWDFGDGETGSGRFLTHTYSAAGNYSILLRVSDGAGQVSAMCDIVIDAPARNRAPVANIAVADDYQNLTFPVDYTIRFSGTGSYDPDGSPLAFAWFVGGSRAGNRSGMDRSFSSPGEQTVTLEVSDGSLSATASVVVNIYRQPSPEISVPPGQKDVRFAGGALSVPAGKGVRFESAVSAGPVPLRTYWDFGDGTEATGSSVTHSYPRPGTYQVACTVRDGYGDLTVRITVNVRATPTTITTSPAILPWAVLAVAILAVVGFAAFVAGTEIGMGLLIPLLIYLYSKIGKDEILDNFLRGRISGYIVANPGDHYTSIRDALDLSNGALAFHLRKLESEGVIKARADGVYKRFYPAEMRVPEPNGGSLTQVQRIVFDKILETPGISQKDIAGILNVSGQTVAYHAEALVRKGRIRRMRAGLSVRYYPEETSFEDV
jgi:PKD repeat protein/predicted transcriptional regulator